jgi:hypothetical protein
MHQLHRRVLPFAAVLAGVGGVAGVASSAQAGSTNVVTAIKTQDAIIKRAPGFKELSGQVKPKTKAQAVKFIADLTKIEKISAHAVDVVAASSTTSAKQREGKQLWVKGSREQNRGILEFHTALVDAVDQKSAAFKTEFLKATKSFTAGTRLGIKGDKLLGLPPTD